MIELSDGDFEGVLECRSLVVLGGRRRRGSLEQRDIGGGGGDGQKRGRTLLTHACTANLQIKSAHVVYDIFRGTLPKS